MGFRQIKTKEDYFKYMEENVDNNLKTLKETLNNIQFTKGENKIYWESCQSRFKKKRSIAIEYIQFKKKGSYYFTSSNNELYKGDYIEEEDMHSDSYYYNKGLNKLTDGRSVQGRYSKNIVVVPVEEMPMGVFLEKALEEGTRYFEEVTEILDTFYQLHKKEEGLRGIKQKLLKEPYLFYTESMFQTEICYNRIKEMYELSCEMHGMEETSYSMNIFEKKLKDSYKKDALIFNELLGSITGDTSYTSKETTRAIEKEYAPTEQKQVPLVNNILKEVNQSNYGKIIDKEDRKYIENVTILLKDKGYSYKHIDVANYIEVYINKKIFLIGSYGIMDLDNDIILFDKNNGTLQKNTEKMKKYIGKTTIKDSEDLKRIYYLTNLMDKRYVNRKIKEMIK